MVRGRVEYDCICVPEHHAGYHAAHFLAAREHRGLFEHILAREQHSAQETFEINLARIVAELAQPVHKVVVRVEERGVVKRQIGRGDGLAPVI